MLWQCDGCINKENASNYQISWAYSIQRNCKQFQCFWNRISKCCWMYRWDTFGNWNKKGTLKGDLTPITRNLHHCTNWQFAERIWCLHTFMLDGQIHISCDYLNFWFGMYLSNVSAYWSMILISFYLSGSQDAYVFSQSDLNNWLEQWLRVPGLCIEDTFYIIGYSAF